MTSDIDLSPSDIVCRLNMGNKNKYTLCDFRLSVSSLESLKLFFSIVSIVSISSNDNWQRELRYVIMNDEREI